METIKQWQLPNKAKVKLPDGTFVTFLKMDGMYAKWNNNGEFQTGNFEAFKKVEDHYEVTK